MILAITAITIYFQLMVDSAEVQFLAMMDSSVSSISSSNSDTLPHFTQINDGGNEQTLRRSIRNGYDHRQKSRRFNKSSSVKRSSVL